MQNNKNLTEQEKQIISVRVNAELAEFFRHRASYGEIMEDIAITESELLYVLGQDTDCSALRFTDTFKEVIELLRILKPFAETV